MDDSKPIGLKISGVTVLSTIFEHRTDALQLPVDTPIGDLKIVIGAEIGVSDDKSGDATMILRVSTAKVEPLPLYRFDIQVAMHVVPHPSAPNMSAAEFLARSGVATMFPYVRELVSNLTMRGRFGSVFLAPINAKEMSLNLLARLHETLPGERSPDERGSRSVVKEGSASAGPPRARRAQTLGKS